MSSETDVTKAIAAINAKRRDAAPDTSRGFRLHIIITDDQDGMLEEFTIIHPANTLERAAHAVKEYITTKFELTKDA